MFIITQNLRHWWWDRFKELIRMCIIENPDVIVLTERRNNKQDLFDSMNVGYKQYIINDIPWVKNTVCILTKDTAMIKKSYNHNILVLEYKWITIWWVYFPQKNEKKWVFDFIDSNLSKTNSIVIGDFNTWKHYIDESWKSFYCHDEFTYLSEEKLTDARRTRFINSVEYSRYSNAWNWFRIDHILVTSDIDRNISEVWYHHQVREKWLSDHSMMFLNLQA